MYVSLVTSYEPTKPPARVCCEIFINGRWKQIKVTKKTFFLVRWDLRLLFSSSQIYSCPYSFDQKFVTPTTMIHLSALDLPKSALIYLECQMNRSCCLLSLWPQNRSLNYLWTFLCLGMPKLKLPVWQRPKRCRPSFSKHRANNHSSLRLQAWWWSKQKVCHQYLSVSAITTNQAPYMLQQSCASLVLACQFGIGIVYLS